MREIAREGAKAAPHSAPPQSARSLLTYRPRAIKEFLEIDWERLRLENELPPRIHAIILKRDRPRLLAALDGLSLRDVRARVRGELLVLRGALRAEADRCPEALADFKVALDGAVPRDVQDIAFEGRAHCRQAADERVSPP